MLTIVLAHAAAALVAPALVRRLGTRAFLALALVPLACFAWVATRTGPVADGEVLTSTVSWVPALDLELALAMGTLQWLMGLIVTGVGALVLAYCAWYFHDDDPAVGYFAGVFLAFAGAMLGLVLADDLLVMYVFWELTTVFSYLLIGYDPTKRASRGAAMQAIIVTTLGGLAMLVGILVLGHEAGTYQVSELGDSPVSGTTASVVVVLLLLGAISKSALFPFHFWLPGAMAAPTPVSAYLHAAAMVKAGVYLVALLAPILSSVPGWHLVLLPLGLFTMLLGGWRALRQNDIKLLLAYGTVSQLGFLLVVAGIGTRSAALAAAAMLVAHALFKASLFLVVGIVDHNAGTRDLRKLSGVGRAMPLVAVTAAISGASMAGLPPLTGYVAKEGVLVALIDVAETGDGTGLGAVTGWTVLLGVVAGSALTAAYTLRFLWGAFWSKPGVETTTVKRVPTGFAAPAALLAALSLLFGFLGAVETTLLTPHAEQFPAGAHEPELTLWHGFSLALWLSVTAVGGGVLLFWLRSGFERLQATVSPPVSAEQGYERGMRLVDRAAVEITGLTQRGSVAIYLSIIMLTVVLLPGTVLLTGTRPDLEVAPWDTPTQAVVGAIVVGAAVLTILARRRLTAVLLLGITGYGTAVLFLLHGAPDIALTQILVETVTLVVFVLVLRRLPDHFTTRPLTRARYVQAGIALLSTLAVAAFMTVAVDARTATPVSADFPEAAEEIGGGYNVVNVTLVDIRAWDTLGEIAVLVVAATGVASLVFIQRRNVSIRRVRDIPYPEGVERQPTTPGRRTWLPGSRTLRPERRSIVFEVVTRLVFHTVVVFSIYLLFAGHNNPGGGFAAGLVTGLALVVRYLAGGRYELDEAMPVAAGGLVGSGLVVATAAGLVPLAFGGAVLQSAILELDLPVIGTIKLVTALFFDIGVYLVVVGLALDLLRSLGSGIDRQILREGRERTALETAPASRTSGAGSAGTEDPA
ncbi:MAG TPA: Na+/H+ antiporter subunit A [Nocardioidaceae bacterium]